MIVGWRMLTKRGDCRNCRHSWPIESVRAFRCPLLRKCLLSVRHLYTSRQSSVLLVSEDRWPLTRHSENSRNSGKSNLGESFADPASVQLARPGYEHLRQDYKLPPVRFRAKARKEFAHHPEFALSPS